MQIKGMKILIAGASGLVGSALVSQLKAEGAEVTPLVRSAAKSGEIEWHPSHGTIDVPALEGSDAVINLAGEGIANGRWTKEKKRRILDSRVNGTRLLSETMALLSRKPLTFINASAVGFYGSRATSWLTKRAARAKDLWPAFVVSGSQPPHRLSKLK